ncbi:MAG TPA: hypothetical protein VG961_12760 [Ignavibacteria bacterium]|nr:hypothetical protein [Ignavibacteria bacterium]
MSPKYYFCAVSFLIFSISINAQDNRESDFISELNMKNDIPILNYGFEVLMNAEIHNNIKLTPVVFGFLDLNLHDEVYYLKNEAGIVLDFRSGEKLSFYGSTGLSINIYRPDENNSLFFHGALLTVVGKTGGGISFLFSVRYHHKLNKKTAIVTSLRYPMGNLESIALTAGIQF